MSRTTWKLALACATVAVGACAEAPATAPVAAPNAATVASYDTLQIGYFSQSPTVAMAQQHGFFAAQHLVVVENQTKSSPMIFQKLRDGYWNVILTQIDNVFNYRYNQSNPLGGTFDPTAIAGTDWGNGASLMSRPELATCESLRGKRFIVDSPNSGFAFVLYGIMRNKCGMEPKVDYQVITTGGTPGRYADLMAGNYDATILNSGYQFKAAAGGMNTIGSIPDAASPFMGGSIVARAGWADAHAQLAQRFIQAMLVAQQYVLDPANKDEVMAWLLADADGDETVATNTYTTLVTQGNGLIPDLHVDVQGLRGTAALRDSFGGFDTPQDLDWLASPESGVYTLTYWQRAIENQQ